MTTGGEVSLHHLVVLIDDEKVVDTIASGILVRHAAGKCRECDNCPTRHELAIGATLLDAPDGTIAARDVAD